MKRILLAAVLLCFAPLAGASAQTKYFYGCGPLVCHSAVATVSYVGPQAYGNVILTKRFSLTIESDFKELSFMPRFSIRYRRPIADGNAFNANYDFVSWSTPITCNSEYTGCVGKVTHSFGGLADDDYSFDYLYVDAFLSDGKQYNMFNPTQQNIGVALQLVPEPSTYALFAAGLGALALLRRRRFSNGI